METIDKSRNNDDGATGRTDREAFLISGEAKKDLKAFGQYLRRERELRNITLDEIAQVTRISRRHLKAIEDGQPEGLPALPFLKGFLAAYARHIGLNTEDVLTFYDEVRLGRPEEAKRPAVPAPEPSHGRRRRLGALVLVVAAAAAAWFLLRRPGGVPEETAPPPASLGGAPAQPSPSVGEEPPPPPVEKAGPEEAGPAGAGDGGVRLELTAVDKTWIYAIVDEQNVRDFFLQVGEKVDLSASRVINLTLGNAGGVEVTFNGKDLGRIGQPGEVKRDILFTWDAQRGTEVKDTFSSLEETGR